MFAQNFLPRTDCVYSITAHSVKIIHDVPMSYNELGPGTEALLNLVNIAAYFQVDLNILYSFPGNFYSLCSKISPDHWNTTKSLMLTHVRIRIACLKSSSFTAVVGSSSNPYTTRHLHIRNCPCSITYIKLF